MEIKEKLSWEVLKPARNFSRQTGMLIGVLGAGAIAVLIFDENPLLAITLGLAAAVTTIISKRPASTSKISLDHTGIEIDEHKYEYQDIKSFWIHYDPNGFQELSLQPKKMFLPYITLPISNINPLEIRDHMLLYLPEKYHPKSLTEEISRRIGF